jgi:hypothetical protein
VSELLPNGEGGFNTKIIDTKNHEHLTTITYLVTIQEGIGHQIVVSASNKQKVKFQGMISYQRAES